MPRIPDELLDTVIYLYPSVNAAEKGERIGGTGFLVSYPAVRFEGRITYAVTNRHVVESGNSVIRLNTRQGDKDVLDFNERQWIYHPGGDDLAVAAFPALSSVFKFEAISLRFFVTRDLVRAHNIGIGDDIIVVGRFINHEGKQKNNPTARFGHLAQMPLEPIMIGKRASQSEQESFLVEARSISGYSGAPVLIDMTAFDRPDRSATFLLLGVQWGYINDWDKVCDAAGNELQQQFKVRTNTGMMGVVPAWKLSEILELPEMKQGRVNAEERWLAEHDLPTATTTDAGQDDEETARRRDGALARALATRPKRLKRVEGAANKRQDRE